MFILIIPAIVFATIVFVNFYYYVANGKFFTGEPLIGLTEIWTVLFGPLIFLTLSDLGEKNDCCTESAVFSPENRVGVYLIIALCASTYFYSTKRKRLSTPIVELLLNIVLILGVLLNVLIAIQINTRDMGALLWLLGNVPVIMLFLLVLKRNKQLLEKALQPELLKPKNALSAFSIKILQQKAWVRFPVLTIFTLPVLLLITLLLFLFGQQPDTLIRAFTETYKHGFSQLDYLCNNVQCGGHFLCSVAANGHKKIVHPERYGERNGGKIICNRQLLIANAFEELIQIHLPFFHKHVRWQYNKVGEVVHSYYHVFNNKFIADFIYLMMKPFEWLFLVTLYAFDEKPENRIARQYLSKEHRQLTEELGRP